jgi:hypothetical protein
MYRLYRAQVIVTFAIFGVVAVPLVVAASLRDRDGPLVLFVVAWIAAFAWNAYWFLLRLCYRLDLEGGMLRWWAPLRSGDAPLAGLLALRPVRLTPNVAVFDFVHGPPSSSWCGAGSPPSRQACRWLRRRQRFGQAGTPDLPIGSLGPAAFVPATACNLVPSPIHGARICRVGGNGAALNAPIAALERVCCDLGGAA